MLEIFAYITFIKKNHDLARDRGRSGVWAGIYTFLLLFFMEIIGYIIGSVVFWDSTSYIMPYIFALPCLFLGALFSWLIAKRGAPIYMQTYQSYPPIPQPQGDQMNGAPGGPAYGWPPSTAKYHPNYQSTPELSPNLTAPCQVVVCRDNHISNASLAFGIELNGQMIGRVKNNQYITAITGLRSNCIVNVDQFGNRGQVPFFFDAPDGGSVELHFLATGFVAEQTVIRPAQSPAPEGVMPQ